MNISDAMRKLKIQKEESISSISLLKQEYKRVINSKSRSYGYEKLYSSYLAICENMINNTNIGFDDILESLDYERLCSHISESSNISLNIKSKNILKSSKQAQLLLTMQDESGNICYLTASINEDIKPSVNVSLEMVVDHRYINAIKAKSYNYSTYMTPHLLINQKHLRYKLRLAKSRPMKKRDTIKTIELRTIFSEHKDGWIYHKDDMTIYLIRSRGHNPALHLIACKKGDGESRIIASGKLFFEKDGANEAAMDFISNIEKMTGEQIENRVITVISKN
ncbi:hypothetical protein [Marinomonas sp. 2405UD68-3]|uniref:hypothetical protein n=1 Tax=Marinomonas sp. 2405UD68-3 TaxID=3391835 RepID=UPI0039C911BF